jgi:hypothetical protein
MNPGYQNIRTIESFEWKCFSITSHFRTMFLAMRFGISENKPLKKLMPGGILRLRGRADRQAVRGEATRPLRSE